jgi:polyhydroxyalkanoate synthase
MRLCSIAAVAAGVGIAVVWLIKDRLTGPAPAPVDAGELPQAPAVPPPPETPTEPEDLSEINGIGPVYKTKLAESGITTFAALATADASELAESIQAPVSRIQAWIDAARRRG